MSNMAENYRKWRPRDWSSIKEMLDWIHREVDRNAMMDADDLGVIIRFSDGSMHRLGDRERKR
jgi:hypothetical protein